VKKEFVHAGVEAWRSTRGKGATSSRRNEGWRVSRTCTICSHESQEEHPGAVPIPSVHREVVLECATEDAEIAGHWLRSTLHGAVEDVLGYQGIEYRHLTQEETSAHVDYTVILLI
jgi:hypothetical protein